MKTFILSITSTVLFFVGVISLLFVINSCNQKGDQSKPVEAAKVQSQDHLCPGVSPADRFDKNKNPDDCSKLTGKK